MAQATAKPLPVATAGAGDGGSAICTAPLYQMARTVDNTPTAFATRASTLEVLDNYEALGLLLQRGEVSVDSWMHLAEVIRKNILRLPPGAMLAWVVPVEGSGE